MTYDESREVLRQAVLLAAGWQGQDGVGQAHCRRVEWYDTDEATHTRPHPYVDLSEIGFVGVGVDETRTQYTYDQPGGHPTDEFESYQVGQRTFTLQVTVKSNVAKGPTSAVAVAKQLITRMRRPGVRELLRVGGFGIARIANIVPVPFQLDGRWYTGATLDVMLTTSATDEQDTSSIATDYFDRVEIQKV